jgi:hypothetical protein
VSERVRARERERARGGSSVLYIYGARHEPARKEEKVEEREREG